MLLENSEAPHEQVDHKAITKSSKEIKTLKFNKTKAIHKTRSNNPTQNQKSTKKMDIEGKEILEVDSTETSVPYMYRNQQSFIDFSQKFAEDKLIPKEHLGDILEIYTFFQYFDPILDGPIFELGELWACFYYQDDKFLDLIHDIHMVLTNLWIKSLFNSRQLFENYQSTHGHSIFLMIYNIYFKEKFRTLVVRTVWLSLLKELIEVYPSYCDNPQELINVLKDATINNYNRLSITHKIQLLLFLIKVSGELQVVKNEHQTKSDKVQELTKKKVELVNKLKDVRVEFIEANKKMNDIDRDIDQLESQQNEGDNKMTKEEAHGVLSQLNSKRKEKNKYSKDFNRVETSKNKLEKELKNIKKDIPMCVHLSTLLGLDYQSNSYYVFRFDNSRIYKCDTNELWTVSHVNFDQLLDTLDINDDNQSTIKTKLQHYLDVELLDKNAYNSSSSKTDDDVITIDDYIAEIFDYKTAYDAKEKRGATKKPTNKMLDDKFNALFNMLRSHHLSEYITYDFIKKITFFLEEELGDYLDLKDSYWIEPEIRQTEFINKINNINSEEDLRYLLDMLDKRWCAITITYIEEESESEEQEREPIKMIVEEKNEENDEEEIIFKRKKPDKVNDVENENRHDQKLVIKSANLKFWNYYMYKSKIMWRDFIAKAITPTDTFFAIIIFGTNLLRFIVNKTEKLLEEQRYEQEQKRKSMEEGKLKELYTSKGSDVHTRYNLRKNRQISKKKDIYCLECMERVGTDGVKCYACGNLYHHECLNLKKSENYSQWRCDECLNKIATKRLTRSMRRQLKYYE